MVNKINSALLLVILFGITLHSLPVPYRETRPQQEEQTPPAQASVVKILLEAVMPKRKAEENTGAKSPRPPPPPYAEEDDDSDFCEIIEAPMSIPPQRATVAPPLAPVPRFGISYQNNSSHGLHAPVNMFPGMSQAVPFVQPVAQADFGFAHMQVPLGNVFQANPLRLRHDVVGDQAGFQDRRFFVEDPMPRPFAFSSAGEASGSGESKCYKIWNIVLLSLH